MTSTLRIPAGVRIVGEVWSVIAGRGAAFGDMENPQTVIQVGQTGSRGVVEITDMILTTTGPSKFVPWVGYRGQWLTRIVAPGAVIVEWNARDPDGHKGRVGMWDTHIRCVFFYFFYCHRF